MCVAGIHDSDDTLQTAASIAELATPAVLPEAEIDDDDVLNDDLGDQGAEDSQIDNEMGDLLSQITAEDHPDVATCNPPMLEMLLKNQTQKTAEQRHERKWIAVELERIAPVRDEWGAKSTERTERSNIGPRLNMYSMVDPVW